MSNEVNLNCFKRSFQINDQGLNSKKGLLFKKNIARKIRFTRGYFYSMIHLNYTTAKCDDVSFPNSK